jgi:transmembrane sensor
MKNRTDSQSEDSIRQAAAQWIARSDAGLTDAEAAEFSRWREADPRHAAALSRYEMLWCSLDRPRGLGVAAEVHRGLATLRRREGRRRLATSAIALAVIVGWIGWNIPGLLPRSDGSDGVVVVMRPERRVLSDGSVIEHSAQSHVEIDFTAANVRRVTLHRGEAHFQVEKDPDRPFVVVAAGTEVRAVGTAFAVQLGAASVEVVVTEGRVAVHSPTPAAGETASSTPVPPALVDSGHRLVVELVPTGNAPPPLAGQVEAISADLLDERLAWRNFRLEFSGTPLGDVIATFNRHASERGGDRFVLADAELRRVPFSGVIRVDDKEALVRILEHGFGLRADRGGEGEVILSRLR